MLKINPAQFVSRDGEKVKNVIKMVKIVFISCIAKEMCVGNP
jgi:hypothetical protein